MTRKAAVFSTLLFGGLILLSALPIWVRGEAVSALGPRLAIDVAGSQAAPGVLGVGLAILAAGVAGGLVGRLGRWIVMAVILLGSGITVGSSMGVIIDPSRPTLAAAARETGVAQLSTDPTLTWWPWIALLLGAAGIVLCVALFRSPATWSKVSRRHERAEATEPNRSDAESGGSQKLEADSVDLAEVWDAQTRGDQD